ncbi:fumarylacetoacetate hydrolase family protein [Rickettsiales endosymbiont of Stachyamoeba lipophora]|uniref:fumarylacetoacetate hydrolase family protein n=1 Tax=Rickettsiales endosymbiont of Stachyamoeba lipophora TaxID=2486578 RepID=UPI000F64D2BF|nr:fumarylacetoacetate hydrolase family protein [Rickettsiales endosymbiont of Stachyamoeba lipophora]AZL15352.1 FAA hydrolase family protein [Rickettsiales endosymbiont of Stachyamoeba lipophora]
MHKIFKFTENNFTKVGLFDGNQHYELPSVDLQFKELLEDANHLFRIAVSDLKKIDNPQFLLPFEDAARIFAVGLNYQDHAAEVAFDLPKYPNVFTRFQTSFVAANNDIKLSNNSTKFDYEGELAVVIKGHAKNIKAEEAHNYIASFTIANDVTVRDYQGKSTQWLLGKNFDNSGSIGPYVLIGSQYSLQDFIITTRLNEEIVQEASADQMVINISQIIAVISESLALKTGDIILTGTPSGVGYKQNPSRFLKSGDKVEVEISNIGKLINYVG